MCDIGVPNDVVLGFDPGGAGNFGAALLRGTDFLTITVNGVREAVAWAISQCGGQSPVAVGIDTLLHWSDGPSGWRPADRFLRITYPEARGSVLSPNGLYGSMAIGGMALAIRLREHWPEVLLNETHPKVLYHALSGARYQASKVEAAIEWFLERAGLGARKINNEHELDALLSAWATSTGLAESWSDLAAGHEQLLFPAGVVSYLWPCR